jgi:CheY-like chemotaxis protein
MIVDDDDDIRETLCDLLEAEGHIVLAAANGREALDLLAGGARPCLILLDLMMPVMDGFAFRAAQQQDETIASIPVVAVTAAGRGVASTISANDVLHKPFGFEQVRTTIDTYC